MKKKVLCRNVIFAVILFIGMVPVSAQSLNDNVIPPSPKAQELLRFGEFPVSLHTGVPQISIPIYTIKLKDYSLPVTLDYNAAGIKVEQEAGEAGLGWTLQAGGVITHAIRGYYDFADEYYFTLDGDDMEDLTGIYKLDRNEIGSWWGELPFTCPSGMSKLELFRRLSNECLVYGSVDFNPDLFQYNFCGNSGKFIFDHKQNIIKEKEDNIKITPVRNVQKRGLNYLSSWILTAPDGTRYYFEQTELSWNPEIAQRQGGRYYSGYYLTRIVTPSNSEISFSYSRQHETIGCYRRLQDSRLLHDFSVRYSYYENIRLDKITFPNGSIELSYQSNRQDLPYGQSLSSVIIMQHGSEPVRWNFNYGYFIADQTSCDMPSLEDINRIIATGNYTDSWNKKRLKLESVVQTAGNSSLPYAFSYQERNLPTKLSASQDHWGYFNNAPNTYLVPSVLQKVTTKEGDVKIVGYGLSSNREPDVNYNQAFLLNGITYPTGGKSFFTYETNEYRTDDFEGDPDKRDFYYRNKEHSIVEGEYAHNIGGDWKDTLHVELTPTEHSYKTRFRVSIDVELDDSYNYAKYMNKKMFFSFYDNKASSYVPWKFTLETPDLPITVNESTRKIHKDWYDVEAGMGTYTMEVYGPLRSYMRNLKFKVKSIETPEQFIKKHPTQKGGGVRIKEIRSYDTDGNMLYGTCYKYTAGGVDDSTMTSGRLMEYPRYRHISENELFVTSDGLRNKGYSVGYTEVSAIDFDKYGQPTGKTTSYYYNHPDVHLCYSYKSDDMVRQQGYSENDLNTTGIAPYKSPGNGNILRKELFSFQDGNYKLQQRTSYKYLAKGDGPYIYWGIRRNVNREVPCVDEAAYLRFMNLYQDGYKKDDVVTGLLYPALIPYTSTIKEERITDYFDKDSVVKTVNNDYNELHQLSKKTVRSGEITDVTEYKYPVDISGNEAVDSLVASNRICNPVSSTHSRGNSIERTEYSYSLFNQVPQLASVNTNTGSGGTMEPRSQCLRYDSHGNMLEVVGSDGVHVVYLWGYEYQFPIAEIKNSTFSAVCAALGVATDDYERVVLSGSDVSATLRKKLPDALVTTYTYLPLIGITRVTLPSGQSMTYEYDSFGRLSCIKNHSGQVVEQYNYHYQKEVQP